jgi:hypothetical protein
MAILRNDVDEEFDKDGNVISSTPVVRDITFETNERTIVTNLAQDMAAIQAELDKTNATINANPAATLKVTMRAQRRIIRKLLQQFDDVS